MKVTSIKWLRRLLLSSIYVLGVLGIVGSGGGPSEEDLKCFTTSFSYDCIDGPLILPPQFDTNTVLSGRFIDSAVEGARFETATQSGSTDENGTFKYITGEAVSFFIGDILLGTSTGATLITPLNFVPGSDTNNPQVINILRFVQSLDEDNNPDNGIRLPDTVTTQAIGQDLDFSLSTAEFENAANALLTQLTSGSVNMLITTSSAQAHFIASLNVNNNRMITGDPFCDDWGGAEDFGCRIVPQGAPPNIGLTILNDSTSISIEIANMQHIELIDTDDDSEEIAVAIFVTNNGAESASVSMKIGLTDENDSLIGYAIANTVPFAPGFSGLVAFTANLSFQNVSPIIYHGMRLDVDVAGGPLTFGEFRQANIFPIDMTSKVGN